MKSKRLSEVLPFPTDSGAFEALERLHSSYGDVTEETPLLGVDRTVQRAVEIVLQKRTA